MYEVTSEPHEFFGASRSEAVAKACSFFGLNESELRIRELGNTDVSGLGSRALVVAIPPGGSPGGGGRPARGEDRGEARSDFRGDRDRGDRGDRGGRGGRGDRDRGRGGRGGRGGGRGDREPRGRERGEARESRDREPAREAAREPAREPRRPARSEDAGPSEGTAKGAIGEIGQFILGVVERMDIGAFEISETVEDRFIAYSLTGAAAEQLTGGDGKGQDALQLLANQAAARLDDDAKRIVVDAEGDPDRREDFLERNALRAARRASDTGRSVALDAMNPRDRRAVHVALRDEEGVATMSIGEGRYRQVLVVPEGAPEYDDAIESTRQAARLDD